MRDVTDLVRLARTGDRNALARLVAAVQDDIWRFHRSRADNDADAEDATQETFARMLAALPELRDPQAFAGWLYRIALNEANAAGRRRGAEQRAADALAAAASTSTENREAEAMERAELQATVRRAVGGLEPRLRTAVELRYEHGLSYADIAQAMDCPEGTVADRLHTAHERLRRALAGAGVAIALAALERELAAAPAAPAPERLGSRLQRMALEGVEGGGGAGAPGGPRPRTVALMLGAAAILAGLVAWRLARPAAPAERDSAAAAPAPAVASATPAATVEAAARGDRPALPGASTPAAATTGRVHGSVRHRDGGEPIARATVTAYRWDGQPGRPIAVSTATDDHGRWSLDLLPGDWELHARAPGFVPLDVTFLVARWRAREEAGDDDASTTAAPDRPELVTVAAGAAESRDFELQRAAAAAFRVTDRHGRPLAGVRARAATQWLRVGPWPRAGFHDEDYLPPAVTDAEGRCAFDGVFPEGELTVVFEGEAVVRRELCFAVDGRENTVELDLAQPLEGAVLDAFGKPLTGARFFGLVDSQEHAQLEEIAVTADELGRFSIPAGAAGARLLVVWAPGHGVSLVPLAGRAPGRAEVLVAEASGTVTGFVRGADGRPIAGADVRLAWSGARFEGTVAAVAFATPGASWHWPDGGAAACLPRSEPAPATVTGPDGSFRLDNLPAGAGVSAGIVVSAPGFELDVAEVQAGTAAEIVLMAVEEEEDAE